MLEQEGVRPRAGWRAGWIAATAVGFATGALVTIATSAPNVGRARAFEVAAHGHASAAAAGDTFEKLMEEAMNRMHAGMAVTPSGDSDVDFAQMMIPHHEGAVDMALVELRFGRDERLRRLAAGIIVEQRQEIEVMRAVLRDPASVPTRPPSFSRKGPSGGGR